MKNYIKPELNISLFDVEDVITASGVDFTGQGEITPGGDVAAKYGLYTDRELTDEANLAGNVVYFSWE